MSTHNFAPASRVNAFAKLLNELSGKSLSREFYVEIGHSLRSGELGQVVVRSSCSDDDAMTQLQQVESAMEKVDGSPFIFTGYDVGDDERADKTICIFFDVDGSDGADTTEGATHEELKADGDRGSSDPDGIIEPDDIEHGYTFAWKVQVHPDDEQLATIEGLPDCFESDGSYVLGTTTVESLDQAFAGLRDAFGDRFIKTCWIAAAGHEPEEFRE